MEERPDIHRFVYWVLLIGMAASTTLFAVGLLLTLARGESVPLDGEWMAQHLSLGALRGLAHLETASILLLATIALIATPILRVAVSAATFAHEKDRLYTAICLVVLGVVAATVVAAKLGLH